MLLGGGSAPPPSGITIESVATTMWSSAVSDPSINLPSGITAGDVLWMRVRTGINPTVHATPAGWTVAAQSGTVAMISWFYRIADGSEGASVTLDVTSDGTTPRTTTGNAIVSRLSGVATNEATWYAINYSGSTSGPDVTAPWGAMANLFVTDYSSRYSDWAVTAVPSGYANLRFNPQGSSSIDTTAVASAHRFLEAASDTVGNWTITPVTGIATERFAVAVFRPAA